MSNFSKEDLAYGEIDGKLNALPIAYNTQTTGKHFFDEKGNLTLTQVEMEAFIAFYKKLLDEKVLMSIDQFDRAQLTSGEVAGAAFWISANTEHPHEAAKLLDYLLNSKEMAIVQGTEKGVPVSKKALWALIDADIVWGPVKE